jgi:hypothetical protein
MMFDSDVEDYLRLTSTPKEELSRYEGEVLDLLMTEIKGSLPDIEPETIRTWIQALFSSIGVHPSLRGLCLSKPVLNFIRDNFFPEGSVGPTRRILEQLLQQFDRNTIKPFLPPQKVYQEEAQLFTFHVKSIQPASNGQPCVLYELWGWKLHTGLRKVMERSTKDQTWKSYATSARAFFTNFPHSKSRRVPKCRDWRAFKKDLEKFKAHSIRNWSPARLLEHCRQLKWLFIERLLDEHPHHGKQGWAFHEQPAPSPLRKQKRGKTTGDDRPSENVTIVAEENEDSSEYDEDCDPRTVDLILTDPHRKVVSRRPYLPYHVLHRYILYQFPFWWDRSSLTRGELRRLYLDIESLSERDETAGVGLLLGMLLYTGRTLKSLLEAKVYSCSEESYPKHADGLYIDPNREILFFKQQTLRSSYRGSAHAGWLDSTRWITIPIPVPLRTIFKGYAKWLKQNGNFTQASQHYFFQAMFKEEIQPLKRKFLGPILHAVLNRTKIPAPTRIAQAFVPLLVHGFGLDNVLARMISGRGFARHCAQIHYTRIPETDLIARYATACDSLHDYITEEMPGAGWWQSSVGTSSRNHPSARTSTRGFGSPLVLEPHTFRRAVERLRKVIALSGRHSSSGNPVVNHNAYTCYVYLILLLLGVRPRNHPKLKRATFTTSPKKSSMYLIVSDKQSALYFEQRVLEMPAVLSQALWCMASGSERVLSYVHQQIDPQSTLPKDLLFFLEHDQKPKAFSLKHFTDLLKSWNIEVLPDAPRNIGRHWIRTNLRLEKFLDDAIDIHLGHQRAGRGAIEAHATTMLGPVLSILKLRMEKMLRDFGFTTLRYFPFCKSDVYEQSA